MENNDLQERMDELLRVVPGRVKYFDHLEFQEDRNGNQVPSMIVLREEIVPQNALRLPAGLIPPRMGRDIRMRYHQLLMEEINRNPVLQRPANMNVMNNNFMNDDFMDEDEDDNNNNNMNNNMNNNFMNNRQHSPKRRVVRKSRSPKRRVVRKSRSPKRRVVRKSRSPKRRVVRK
jgi:hypothetical protein